MSGTNRRFFITIGAGLFCLTCCADSVLAGVAKVVANLFDGNADTSFDGTTLRVQQNDFPSSDPLLLWSAVPRNDFTNIAVELVVDYQGVGAFTDGSQFGIFGDGHIAITFEDQQGSYELSGPVELLKMATSRVNPGANPSTEFSGFGGLFEPTTTIMPVDYEWVVPDFPGGPFSQIDDVNILIDGDIGDYDWSAPVPWGQAESEIVLLPASIPEPTLIGLLMLGGLMILYKTRFMDPIAHRRG